jgi:hypothetical protein
MYICLMIDLAWQAQGYKFAMIWPLERYYYAVRSVFGGRISVQIYLDVSKALHVDCGNLDIGIEFGESRQDPLLKQYL